MQMLNNINLDSALDTLVSSLAAFILGGLIGLERHTASLLFGKDFPTKN